MNRDFLSMPALRYGMVGGGEGAFIADAHRRAIALDGMAALTAGCFSRDRQNSLKTGKRLGVSEERVYATYGEMAQAEAAREDGIDFVVVVTPNSSHFDVCKAFLESGIHVVCDKPLVFEVAQAEALKKLAEQKKLLFGVTYTYSGHVTLKQAREIIARGDIGDIRMVMGEYPQDWLAVPNETEGKQAAWRIDPKQTGRSNCFGDIGSHIENTVSYVTGLKIKRLLSKLDVIVPGRVLDDNGVVLIEYEGGASGAYWASQVAPGCANALKVRVYGSKGAIEWSQERCEELKVTIMGQPSQMQYRGGGYMYPAAASQGRLPGGHPEGYFEAMANIYHNYCCALIKTLKGEALTAQDMDYPGVDAGLDGVKFINAVVDSTEKGNVWVTL